MPLFYEPKIFNETFFVHVSRFDKEVEETAQRAISEFFAKNNIVPSPWQGPNGKPVFVGVPKSSHGGQFTRLLLCFKTPK